MAHATIPGGGENARFPGFDVLAQAGSWDQVTAGVVLSRLAPPEALRFFSIEEEPTARALLDQLLDQRGEPRIPVLEMVDARLAENRTDGWHYADLPDDREAWHVTLAGLDEDARELHGAPFAELAWDDQGDVVQAVQDAEEWHGWPAKHVWSLWTRYACTAFYSHPWAWNEIGFGGPAYPRGFKNIGIDSREPWEVRDRAPRDPLPYGAEVKRAKDEHLAASRRQHDRRREGISS